MSAPRTVGREAVPATLIDLAARKVALIESVGRMVRIDYPKRIPPGWGRHPGLATAIGPGQPAGRPVRGPHPLPTHGRPPTCSSRAGTEASTPLDSVGITPTVATAVWLLRAVLMLAAAVPDPFEKREVAGVVLRIRPHEKAPYLALDDGRGPKVRAWLVAPPLLSGAGLTQGAKVWATVTPRLGHVSRLAKFPRGDDAGLS